MRDKIMYPLTSSSSQHQQKFHISQATEDLGYNYQQTKPKKSTQKTAHLPACTLRLSSEIRNNTSKPYDQCLDFRGYYDTRLILQQLVQPYILSNWVCIVQSLFFHCGQVTLKVYHNYFRPHTNRLVFLSMSTLVMFKTIANMTHESS